MMCAMPDFDALTAELLQEPGVEEGTGFGSTEGLRVGGRIFVMHMDGDLVVKLPADRCAELADAGHGRPFRSGGREMREWVVVGEEHADEWLRLAEDAHAFVGG